jgi:hypothetical protein
MGIAGPRTLSKISLAEKGQRYASAQLAALGLETVPEAGQGISAWMDAARPGPTVEAGFVVD